MSGFFSIHQDKRRRSYSSLTGIEEDSSRRKLDARTLIPETDDQFTLAEARCKDLQNKLDLVRNLKKKRKLKKRSNTQVVADNASRASASVQTLLSKTKLVRGTRPQASGSPPARRPRPPMPRDIAPLPRGCQDATQRMFARVRQINDNLQRLDGGAKTKQSNQEQVPLVRRGSRRGFADGDNTGMMTNPVYEGCRDNGDFSNSDTPRETVSVSVNKRPNKLRKNPPPVFRRRLVPKEIIPLKEVSNAQLSRAGICNVEHETTTRYGGRQAASAGSQPIRRGSPSKPASTQQQEGRSITGIAAHSKVGGDRSVVELFHKNRMNLKSPMGWRKQDLGRVRENQPLEEKDLAFTEEQENNQENHQEKNPQQVPRGFKYRSHGYELPTVASKMKQASPQRFYYEITNSTKIPFIVSKSTAPSHNIGVNIQQVLNGLKIQQPLSKIPLTIAHHMGLGHLPHMFDSKTRESNPAQRPSLDMYHINVIRVGHRLLRLPSKKVSYNRLLRLYRNSEGVVSRFLRHVSRPPRFYTSMYNLMSREDEAAESKTREVTQRTKQSLAEYAALFREYERLDKSLKTGEGDAAMKRHCEELERELVAREEEIRWVVRDFEESSFSAKGRALRASASTAEPTTRYSNLKINDEMLQ